MKIMLRQIFSILTLCVFVIGCTNNNPQGRLAIEGEVTLEGKPLAQGHISFDPSGSQPIKTQSGSLIKNGKYSIAAVDGLAEGEYTVSIRSMEEIPKTQENTGNEIEDAPEYKNIVPPEFGEKSTQKITVEKGKQNKFDFKM
jgi:hypothetical protein